MMMRLNEIVKSQIINKKQWQMCIRRFGSVFIFKYWFLSLYIEFLFCLRIQYKSIWNIHHENKMNSHSLTSNRLYMRYMNFFAFTFNIIILWWVNFNMNLQTTIFCEKFSMAILILLFFFFKFSLAKQKLYLYWSLPHDEQAIYRYVVWYQLSI